MLQMRVNLRINMWDESRCLCVSEVSLVAGIFRRGAGVSIYKCVSTLFCLFQSPFCRFTAQIYIGTNLAGLQMFETESTFLNS